MTDSHTKIQNLVTYVPETGRFHWRISHGNRRLGDAAGHADDRGRPKIQVDGNRYLQSRLAWFWMTGAWPKNEIDHINGNHADNRWSNLRQATRSQNECNKSLKANNTSGRKGVRKVNNRWRAEIMVNQESQHIGYFDTARQASVAYKIRAKRLHGEYYCE